jgi:hypothetical protein
LDEQVLHTFKEHQILRLPSEFVGQEQPFAKIGGAMEIQNQPNHSHLTINISPELHQYLQKAAAQRNISVREYVETLLEQTLLHEAKASQQQRLPMSREAFEGLLQLRGQFKRNHPGQVLDDSTELIRQMREERSQYLADL